MGNKSNVILTILLVVATMFIVLTRNVDTKDNAVEVNEYEQVEEVVDQKQAFYDNCDKSVVQICAVLEDDKSLGSGFFVEENKIATNYHVIKDSRVIYVLLKDDDTAYRAAVYSLDKENDLAILNLVDEIYSTTKTLELSPALSRDEIVYACGFDLDYNVKATKVIEDDYEYKGNNYIKIDKPVNQGNSGGPVLNSAGQVIGMVMFGNNKNTSLIPAKKVLDLIQ